MCSSRVYGYSAVVEYSGRVDKEDIFDCLNTLETLEVNKKAVRMWYLMNKDTKISVKTAFGMTKEADIGDCLGQGTAGAGLVSAANLDMGLQKHFKQSREVLKFGKIRIQPLCYQDDVSSPCSNIDMAKKASREDDKDAKREDTESPCR